VASWIRAIQNSDLLGSSAADRVIVATAVAHDHRQAQQSTVKQLHEKSKVKGETAFLKKEGTFR
jgi:hypothetical protein